MKIGIIVYSQTGNTLKACELIKTKMDMAKHVTTIEKVEIETQNTGSGKVILTNSPDPSAYEAVIFAAPVQAFSLAVPMSEYMKTLRNLEGKKAAFLTTKSLPFKWTGGNHALSQMSKLAKAAGAETVLSTDLILWADKITESKTGEAAVRLSALFK